MKSPSKTERRPAMPRGGRKKRRNFRLLSCFSAPAVWDPDESEFQPDALPLTCLTRLRRLSRTVPVMEIAGGRGHGRVKVLEEIESEGPPALLSPAGNDQDRGSALRFRKKEKKKIKPAVQPLPHTPQSAWSHNQQSIFFHVSTRYSSTTCHSRSQPLYQLHRACDPVQTVFRAISFSPKIKRTADPATSLTRPTRRLDLVTVLLMLFSMLTLMLFFGRLSAVLCNCVWFYLLSYITPPSPPPPPPTAAEVDVDSPDYKKKVVLMGLLERNRYGVSGMPITPMGCPAKAGLRQPW